MIGHTHIDGHHSEVTPELWGVYIKGMDEWTAAPSWHDAMKLANQINADVASREPRANDPHMWAIPDLWPFSVEDHGEELRHRLEANAA